MAKKDGGMGFRNLHVFNVPLLGKQGWGLMTQSDTLVAKLFKAKYFPKCNFLEAKHGSNSSFVCTCVLSARSVCFLFV